LQTYETIPQNHRYLHTDVEVISEKTIVIIIRISTVIVIERIIFVNWAFWFDVAQIMIGIAATVSFAVNRCARLLT